MPDECKHALLDALKICRTELGLNRTAIELVRQLLSLHRPEQEDRTIVFASVALLADRIGVDPSTVNRSTRRLEEAGLVSRRLSPNGKRYALRTPSGTIMDAFGIDLVPLLGRIDEIIERAGALQARDQRVKALKSVISARLSWAERDGLLTTDIALDMRKSLRRKGEETEFEALLDRLEALLSTKEQNDLPCKMPATRKETARYKDTQSDTYKKDRQENVGINQAQLTHAYPRFMQRLQQNCQDASIRQALHPMVFAAGLNDQIWSRVTDVHSFEESVLLLAHLYENKEKIRNPKGYMLSLSDRIKASSLSLRAIVMSQTSLETADRRQRASDSLTVGGSRSSMKDYARA